VGIEEQMMERWGEYQRMVAKGKGLLYRAIIEEFRDKMENVLEQMPENVEAKQGIIRWMQQQMPGVGEVRLRLMREACERIRGELENLPEVGAAIEEMENELENYEQELPTATPGRVENIRACAHLIRERIKDIIERYRHRMRHPIIVYIDIDNIVIDIDVKICAENKIPKENLIAKFDEKLAMFENELTEIQGKLENLPENARIRTAVETLVNNAIKLENRAVAIKDEKPRRALGLLNAACMLLRNAERILEHVEERVENIEEFIENRFSQELQRLRQLVDNLPDTVYRTGLSNLLDLAQNAFNDGNYELAKWYLERVEDFLMGLRRGWRPWPMPRH
jgi:DNA repair exonuclease SbcCD ATPase subunit